MPSSIWTGRTARQLLLLAALDAVIGAMPLRAEGRAPSREQAARAAIHPVRDAREMRAWLSRVPLTRDFRRISRRRRAGNPRSTPSK